MRLLLDTHILLWALDDSPRLGHDHRKALKTAEAIYVSAASIWEIAVKRAAGKLDVDGNVGEVTAAAGCRPLPITWAHAEAAGALPLHHTDPFDRLLIAQAQLEGLTLMTVDKTMRRYEVANL